MILNMNIPPVDYNKINDLLNTSAQPISILLVQNN